MLWLATMTVFFFRIQSGYQTDLGSLKKPVNIILILGSGKLKCRASPVLAARLDVGIIWAKQLPNSQIVVSGGGRRDCTEGQVMGDYLRANGIAPTRIFQEERSQSTYENFVLSRRLLEKRGLSANHGVLIVTSDFHILRSSLIAKRAGLTAVASASTPTPLYLRYNAWTREYFAFISGYLLGEF